MRLGIDASRNRSGGAKAHLIGLIENAVPSDQGFESVHVWSYKELLNMLPDRPWLVRHCPPELEQSILHQVWWQRRVLPKALVEQGCTVVLNTDAGTVSRFRPSVTMSRNMLPYEPEEIERYGWSKAGLRLALLRQLHSRSLKHASGAIFLTQYAANTIQKSIGSLPNARQIPHGIGENFRLPIGERKRWPDAGDPIECVYVSNAAPYKHQWVVVRAIDTLRQGGMNIRLTLIGGGDGPAQVRLAAQIQQSDPAGAYVKQLDVVPHGELPGHLAKADMFVFASSCENMPNTLLEGMAAGLPIACSNKGPMPEILKDAGVYFDPENYESIACAIASLAADAELRACLSERARRISQDYSWRRCSNETFAFLADVSRRQELTSI